MDGKYKPKKLFIKGYDYCVVEIEEEKVIMKKGLIKKNRLNNRIG